MSTIGVVRDLGELFLWVGIGGAGLALLCAIAVGVALAMGAAGFAGGAAAVWIGGALSSLASGFSGQWIPAIVAGGALFAAIVLGSIGRVIVRRVQARPTPERGTMPVTAPPAAASASTLAVPAHAPAPAPAPAPQRIVGVHTVASESIR